MHYDLDFIKDIDEEKLSLFKDATKNDLIINSISEKTVYDYSWIEVIDNTLMYIDNIIRNPRKFIIPEEEVLIVEKTKKVNEETVKHLAQHSSLIQDIEDDGNVRPKKLLNANKEETYDLYENRFILTLIKRLRLFIQLKKEEQKTLDRSIEKKIINYNGYTKLKEEVIKVDVVLEKSKSYKDYNINSNIKDINKKIYEIEVIINSFFNTAFIKSISQATPVHSPIRKTNLILKDPNFQQAVKLWEFLDMFENSTGKKVERKSEKSYNDLLKNKYLVTSFINYDNIDYNTKEKNKDEKLAQILRLINEYALESDISLNNFQKALLNTFNKVRKEEEKAQIAIKKCCDNFINDYYTKVNKIVDILK